MLKMCFKSLTLTTGLQNRKLPHTYSNTNTNFRYLRVQNIHVCSKEEKNKIKTWLLILK